MFRRRSRKQISLLVPIGGNDPTRQRNWRWLRRYWSCKLPGAEIVIGRDKKQFDCWRRKKHIPFSKAAAINDAFRRSHGDIIVILDSDAYLDAMWIEHCAERLRMQRRKGVRSWFVPYHHLYRLTRRASAQLLASNPCHPLHFTSPPPAGDVDGRDGSGPLNVYGAMCTIVPREAFEEVGGMDPRFRGWGAEDYAFALALDWLWGFRQHTPNDILHVWHPSFMTGGQGKLWQVKMWENQTEPGMNDALGVRYQQAAGDPVAMRNLVDEGMDSE